MMLAARCALPIAALSILATGQAGAEDAPAPPPEKSAPKDAGLSWRGLTLYGQVDIGLAHQDHGAPLSPDYASGLPFLIQKFNNRPITSFAPNGLSQSKIGLSGDEPIAGDISAVFRLETGFVPTSMHLADGLKSLVASNGKPLNEQHESGDSSRAGQLFQSAAYAGLQSQTWGAVTFGRQNSLILDDLQKYDPQLQAQAFSPIGYSGVTAGGGDTEDGRLDQTVKIAGKYGQLRFAYLHQFRGSGPLPGGADQADAGADIGGLSFDVAYSHISDAVSAASLTSAQAAVAPGTLAGTISDNSAWTVQGRYAWKRLKVFAGYEHAAFADPSHPVPAGIETIGGYTLSSVNNTAFVHHKVLQVSWAGMRYALTPRLELAGGYYRYDQNSYRRDGCRDRSAAQCAGQMNAGSVTATYRLTRHFDLYGGLNYSSVANGLASGFLQTEAFSQMAGVRFSF